MEATPNSMVLVLLASDWLLARLSRESGVALQEEVCFDF